MKEIAERVTEAFDSISNGPGQEVIDESSVKEFYCRHELNSEETILEYIRDCINSYRIC